VYLIDTDIVSYLLSPRPPPALARRAAQELAERNWTSTITIGEVAFGAYRTRRPGHYLDRFRRLIAALQVAGFDAQAAWRYGELRAELERRGRPLPEPDLRIAAVALSRGLVLVTHNRRHFERVPGLLIEDWTA
jgi:tRNA(fMet)-specific endonuclease VapC